MSVIKFKTTKEDIDRALLNMVPVNNCNKSYLTSSCPVAQALCRQFNDGPHYISVKTKTVKIDNKTYSIPQKLNKLVINYTLNKEWNDINSEFEIEETDDSDYDKDIRL